MFSDPNGIKLNIKNKNMLREFPYIWRLDNIFQNNPKIKEEVSNEILKYIEISIWKDSQHHMSSGNCKLKQ